MPQLKNPILSGFYPDPSVCKKGEDFYLVTSTFEYFPGVPVFHSKDFVHWQQIGHCLDRPSQLNLDGIKASQGIYAPTIRYHDGVFYMITTLVQDPPYVGNVNFYVTAKDPAGPWSEPIVVKGAPGIDPTIFFDQGKAYYLGNLRPQPDQRVSRHIWLQEMDILTGDLLGERHILRTDGAVYGARAPEAPHLYKKDGYYYLLLAEGGTSYNHAVTVFRSKELTGPYEVNPRNPILTHRHLGRDSEINSTGHADFIEVTPGNWWAVLLASRPVEGMYRNLGRETFAVPMIWEEDWPVLSPKTGKVEFSYPAPNLEEYRFEVDHACDHFDKQKLELYWNTLRTPQSEFYSLSERPSYLRLFPQAETIYRLANPSFVGRRQQHMEFSVRTKMEFAPKGQESAGLVILQNNDYQIRFELFLNNMTKEPYELRVIRREKGADVLVGSKSCKESTVLLKIEGYGQNYNFYFATLEGDWVAVATNVDGRILSSEVAGGFTGAYIGMYASTNGSDTGESADFDWFEYRSIDN